MSSRERKLEGLAEYVEHMRPDHLQEALEVGMRLYWQHRADVHAACLPRPGDHLGGSISGERLDVDWVKGWPTEGTSRYMNERTPVPVERIARRPWPSPVTQAQLDDQRDRINAVVLACRQRAALSLVGGRP